MHRKWPTALVTGIKTMITDAGRDQLLVWAAPGPGEVVHAHAAAAPASGREYPVRPGRGSR